MAKVREITIHYSEKLSSEYQSCEIGAEMTLVLEDGENAGQIFHQYYCALRDRVAPLTVQRVEDLIAEKRQRGWK